jgi:hypothetical protein
MVSRVLLGVIWIRGYELDSAVCHASSGFVISSRFREANRFFSMTHPWDSLNLREVICGQLSSTSNFVRSPGKPEHRSWRHRIRRHHWQHKPPGDLGQYQLDTAAAIANVLCRQAWHRLRPLELRNSGSTALGRCGGEGGGGLAGLGAPGVEGAVLTPRNHLVACVSGAEAAQEVFGARQ